MPPASADVFGLQTFIIIFVLAVSVTTTEIIRGYFAYLLGDRYGYIERRLTTNPLELVDFIGTIALPLILILCQSPLMGASCHQIQIDFAKIKFGKLGIILAILAKPFSEFLLCTISILLFHFSRPESLAMEVLQFGAFLNAFLVALSFLPILPLSGGQLVAALLPPRLRYKYEQHAPYALFIFLFILIFLPFMGVTIVRDAIQLIAMHVITIALFLVRLLVHFIT